MNEIIIKSSEELHDIILERLDEGIVISIELGSEGGDENEGQ